MTAEGLLKQAFGQEAAFRDGQQEAIQAATKPGARTLIVQRTGWGKSIVYFISTVLLRKSGCGPTLLVSPLLSLMRNQEELAAKFGVRAKSINSTNKEDWEQVEEQLNEDAIDLLIISPERLSNAGFRQRVLEHIEKRLGLLVVDEAHCISDWGHDFRPDYKRIVQTVQRLNASVPILCTTATANDRVVQDIRSQLGQTLVVSRGPLVRASLRLRVLKINDQAERLAMLAKLIPKLRGTGIVYTLTVNDARRVAGWLQQNNIGCAEYHAGLEHEQRLNLERAFNANDLKCLVATTALGMGYDKPDVAFVVHFQRPGSIISYYQQVGRAGRMLDRAEVILFEGDEDDEINDYFIESAFPPRECFEEILGLLQERPRTHQQLVRGFNYREGHIQKALTLMEVHGAIRLEEGEYTANHADWTYEDLNVEEIGRLRRKEAEEMREYVSHRGCKMQFLARALDDLSAAACGVCSSCAPVNPPTVTTAEVAEAQSYLRGDRQELTLRRMYPPGILADGRKKIPESDRFLPGATLCVYNDAGWGKLVREGKYLGNAFSDELVDPSVRAIRALAVQPDWVCWVPSKSRANLVPDFSKKLASALGVGAVDAVRKVNANSPQKLMQNSSSQFDNVKDNFEVVDHLPGVCLVVDDVVDSGWTLTAIGIKLVQKGAAGVIPFALATAKPRD